MDGIHTEREIQRPGRQRTERVVERERVIEREIHRHSDRER